MTTLTSTQIHINDLAGMSGWCMCRATANALSMPAMSTGV
jgi:hypothetical protein